MKPKIKNYIELLKSGELTRTSDLVAAFILNNKGTNLHTIRQGMKASHQTITSAISNLMDKGFVKETGETIINDFHYSTLEFVTDETEQQKISKRRNFDKYIYWLKRGLSDYSGHLPNKLMNEICRDLKRYGYDTEVLPEEAEEETSKFKQMELF